MHTVPSSDATNPGLQVQPESPIVLHTPPWEQLSLGAIPLSGLAPTTHCAVTSIGMLRRSMIGERVSGLTTKLTVS